MRKRYRQCKKIMINLSSCSKIYSTIASSVQIAYTTLFLVRTNSPYQLALYTTLKAVKGQGYALNTCLMHSHVHSTLVLHFLTANHVSVRSMCYAYPIRSELVGNHQLIASTNSRAKNRPSHMGIIIHKSTNRMSRIRLCKKE